MNNTRKRLAGIFACALTGVLLSAGVTACGKEENYRSIFTTPEYAVNALSFEEMDTYEGEVRKGSDSNQGALENGMILSPYLTCQVNGKEVDVYASRCSTGAHSFSYVDVTEERVGLDIRLTLAKTRQKVVVLPESRGVKAEMAGKTVSARIEDTGSYSFAFDDKEDRAFTLIVRRASDFTPPEGYEVEYFEPGAYTAAQTTFTEGKKVYWFKEGSYALDSISLPSDSILYCDYAYFSVTNATKTSALKSNDSKNVKVLGKSVFDFTGIDQDVDGKGTFDFSGVQGFEFEGVTSIGSCGWTFNFNRCTGGRISNIAGFAYRTFTDGIMIANSSDMRVSDSFMRTGDDAFEVKSTGTGASFDIVYSDCHAWNDKAVGFGVIYEMNYPVENVRFLNCSVGFNMPVWDVTRAAASVCMCDYEKGLTNKDISFENFEVYYSLCPIISLCLHSGTLENITFKNFSLARSYAEYPVYIKFNASYLGGAKPTEKRLCKVKSVYFDDVKVEGSPLSSENIFGADLPDSLYLDGEKYQEK